MKKTLGERLRLLRGLRTQEEIAKAVGVTKNAISQYETDKRVPGDEVKKRICKVYEMGIEQLFFND